MCLFDIDIFKSFNVFIQKNLQRFKLLSYGGCVFLDQPVVQIVLVVSAFFFRVNKFRLHQNFDVVTDAGLRQVQYILNFGALARASFFRNMLQYL